MKTTYQYFLWMVLGAILLWLSWSPIALTPLAFTGFVPFLFVTDQLSRQAGQKPYLNYAKYIYTGLLVWNILTTYWVCYATVVGGIIAIMANAVLMTVPFLLFFRFMRAGFNRLVAYTALICFWIALEYLHLNWELAWPWLNLGNVFSATPAYVQWYEYTGAFGGTLWILLMNIGLYEIIRSAIDDKARLPRVALVVGLALVPILISYLLPLPKQPAHKIKTAVIQPNIDPYNEKFSIPPKDQIGRLISQSNAVIDSSVDLLIWPETAIPNSINEATAMNDQAFRQIRDFLNGHPQITLLSGLNSYQRYDEQVTHTARPFQNSSGYFDLFNAAIKLDTAWNPEFYHKSILVPGVERMPYPEVFGFLESMAIDMGGTSGSLGSQEEASIVTMQDSLKLAPVICYESVYGDYVGDFVNKGADVIAVITNDGWWGNTAGYRQHFQYSRLRAIELRRAIARSANTGISGFITPEGAVHQKTDYWVQAAKTFDLPVYKEKTFYARHGDFIAKGALTGGAVLLILGIIHAVGSRRQK